jgi:metal-responsive CopG/Arc/MetJ family transcriptional regulator
MKTVQMTLDEGLVAEVDRAVRKLKTTRSAFAREALRAALQSLAARELDRRHRAGYLKKPPAKNEFALWEKEHAWGDE